MAARTFSTVAALALAGLLLAGTATAQSTAAEATELAALEQRLQADPDNLMLGARYRQLAIRLQTHDRAIAFFERLVADHPGLANAELNLGYAYVDKVPVAGTFTRPFLANGSLAAFSRAIAIRPSWLALYTRGNGYLFWPSFFGKADDAEADLRAALRLQPDPPRPHHANAYVALGDARYRQDALADARAIWAEGARRFAGNAELQGRLAAQGEALEALIDDRYVIGRPVDTSLQEMATP